MNLLLSSLFCSDPTQDGIEEGQDLQQLIPQILSKGICNDDYRVLRKLAGDMKRELHKKRARLVSPSGFAARIRDPIFRAHIQSLDILSPSELEDVKAQKDKCSAAEAMIDFLHSCSPSRLVLFAWVLIKVGLDHFMKSIGRLKERLKLFKSDEIKELAERMEDVQSKDQEGAQSHTSDNPHNLCLEDILHDLSPEKARRIQKLCTAWSEWATPQKGQLSKDYPWHRVDHTVNFRSIVIECKKSVCIKAEYKAVIELMTCDGQDHSLPKNLMGLLLPDLPKVHGPERITPVKEDCRIETVSPGRRRIRLAYISITHISPPNSTFWRNIAIGAGVVVAIVIVGGVIYYVYSSGAGAALLKWISKKIGPLAVNSIK